VTRSTITLPNSTGSTHTAEVFAPAEATGALPLVIFNHGFQLSAAEFTSYGERLASHGFVAVLPTIGDNLLSARTHAELGADAIVWLTHLVDTSDGYDGGYDPDAIGIAGHSRGGKQSLLAAADDARFAAVFGIDPVDSGPPIGNNPTDYPSVAPERMGDLSRPVGLVGAGRAGESVGFGPACAPTDENYAQYFAAAPGPAWAWTLPEAGHLDFLDACSNPLLCNTCTAGSDPTGARDFARATMIAFFRAHLLDDTTCNAWLDGDAMTADASVPVTVETR
jgi:predicted dienelactone hydrolase